MKEIYKKQKGLDKVIKNWKDPEFSEIGKKILNERYLMRNEKGDIIEDPKELIYRVAHVISDVDKRYKDFNADETKKEFYDLMAEGKFLPNSPTLRGAGLNINLSACYVLPITDDREGIFKKALYDAVEIQAHGGGTGFNFSQLRPKGALIRSTKGKSSGPISFLKVFDTTIGSTIAQGGTRQGANMGILKYDHPDIEEFISCKADGGIRNFNLSIGITEDFMKMAQEGKEYPLIDHEGKETKKVNAKHIFDRIVHYAHKRGDPGLIYLDRIQRDNPTPNMGEIKATNPCGEQPLLDYESCNLGSINLSKFVKGKEIDWEELGKTVYSSVHFLDNVIDANEYPLKKTDRDRKELENILERFIPEKEKREEVVKEYSVSPIEKIVKENRKIGLGVMGFSNMLIQMGLGYGSEESYKIAEEVMRFIDDKSKEASVKLAATRGTFPNWKDSIYDSESKNFKGKDLKLRNAATTTIAPTGTLSTLLGINGGIEPMFGLISVRKSIYDEKGKPKLEEIIVDSEFEKIAKENGIYSEELNLKISDNKGSLEGVQRPLNIGIETWRTIQSLFVTANDLSYKEHIKMQSAFQRHLDNAVSKTINLKEDATEDDVRNAYLMTLNENVKGITIYRDGSIEGQVLSTGIKGKNLKDGERPDVIGTTIKQRTPYGSAFVTLNVLKTNPKNPYECFIEIGKAGSDVKAITEAYGRLISLMFKEGIPVSEIAGQLRGIGGETQVGVGKDRITSISDAIGKGIESAYILLNKDAKKHNSDGFNGNLCPLCGAKMVRDGGCPKCTSCGYSKC